MRTPGVTLDTDELERELGAIDELERELGATDEGTELEVVAMLELLGATELVVVTEELLGALDELELLGLPSTTTKKLRVAEFWPPLPSFTVKVAV